MNDSRIDRILTLLLVEGRNVQVHGLSVAEHSLHTAALAWKSSAPLTLVSAALLHDIGLLVDEMVGNPSGLDLDPRHEVMGADVLEPVFGSSVAEPVRLHEAAGRYLAATEAGYRPSLPAVLREELDGAAAMTDEQVRTFAADPWAAAAVRLRRWDDAAQVHRSDLGAHWLSRQELSTMLQRVAAGARGARRPLSA